MERTGEALRRIVTEGLESGCYPSACAAVGVRERVLAECCVGEAPLPGGAPACRDTLYDMASVSKILGPTMLALLALERGMLTLDTRVGEDFDAPEDKRAITVRMLMTHTAGFEPSFRLDRLGIAPGEAAEAILRRPLAYAPGTRADYSCMGYILLGKLLERRYGAPLDALAREHVFAPLGMARTAYGPAHGVCAATEADPVTGVPLAGVVHDENARFLGGVSGNAGVFMPLCDGERFCAMLAKMGEGLLARETMALAIRNATPGLELRRGLGFQLAGTPDCFFGAMPDTAFGHTGFTGTSIAVEPRTGFWLLLLSNRVCPTRDNPRLMPLRRALHTACWQAFAAETGA